MPFPKFKTQFIPKNAQIHPSNLSFILHRSFKTFVSKPIVAKHIYLIALQIFMLVIQLQECTYYITPPQYNSILVRNYKHTTNGVKIASY